MGDQYYHARYERELEKQNEQLREKLEAALIENERLSNRNAFSVSIQTEVFQNRLDLENNGNSENSEKFPVFLDDATGLLNEAYINFLCRNALFSIAKAIDSSNSFIVGTITDYSKSRIGKEKYEELFETTKLKLKKYIQKFCDLGCDSSNYANLSGIETKNKTVVVSCCISKELYMLEDYE